MGLLTDFLGAMAQTGGSMLEQDRKQKEEEAKEARLLERQKAMADYTADINTKKAELLEQLREEREQRKQQKYVDDMATAEGTADDIGYQRRFDAFKKKIGQTDATDDELKEGFKAYDDKRIMVDGKVDKQFADRATDKADDMVTAARKTGNMGLIESTLKSRQEARATQSAADKAEYDERRLEQKDKSEKEERDRREKADDRKYDLIEQRIAKSGSAKADKPEDTLKERNQIVREIKALEASAPKKPDVSKMPERMASKAMDAWTRAHNEWVNNTEEGQLLQELRERQRELLGSKSTNQSSEKPKSETQSDRKVGTTQVVASGPHKGKTAVWDGQGWKLK